MKIYLSKDGQQQGPYDISQVRQLLYEGQFNTRDSACYDGQWVLIGQLPNLFLTEDDQILSVTEKEYVFKRKPWAAPFSWFGQSGADDDDGRALYWGLTFLFVLAQILGQIAAGGLGMLVVCIIFSILFFIIKIASKGKYHFY
ncbi:MAG: hypothetical protein CMI31_09590 [Opitutae bacterium]|nr:hypothetical protein [Opitutae bacterium]